MRLLSILRALARPIIHSKTRTHDPKLSQLGVQ